MQRKRNTFWVNKDDENISTFEGKQVCAHGLLKLLRIKLRRCWAPSLKLRCICHAYELVHRLLIISRMRQLFATVWSELGWRGFNVAPKRRACTQFVRHFFWNWLKNYVDCIQKLSPVFVANLSLSLDCKSSRISMGWDLMGTFTVLTFRLKAKGRSQGAKWLWNASNTSSWAIAPGKNRKFLRVIRPQASSKYFWRLVVTGHLATYISLSIVFLDC